MYRAFIKNWIDTLKEYSKKKKEEGLIPTIDMLIEDLEKAFKENKEDNSNEF